MSEKELEREKLVESTECGASPELVVTDAPPADESDSDTAPDSTTAASPAADPEDPQADDDEPRLSIWRRAAKPLAILLLMAAVIGWGRVNFINYYYQHRTDDVVLGPLAAGSLYSAWVGDSDVAACLQVIPQFFPHHGQRAMPELKKMIEQMSQTGQPMMYTWGIMSALPLTQYADPSEGLPYAQRLVKAYPETPLSYLMLSALQMATGDSKSSTKSMEQAIFYGDKNPNELLTNGSLSISYAQVLQASGQPEKALDVINQTKLPKDRNYYRSELNWIKGRCLFDLGRTAEALALVHTPEFTSMYEGEKLRLLLHAGFYKEVLATIQSRPDAYWDHAIVSRAYENVDLRKALDEINKESGDYRSGETWYQRARVQNKLGMFNDALKSLGPHPPAGVNPTLWANFQVQRSIALTGLGRPEEGLKCAMAALNFNPRLGGAYTAAANALDKLGKPGEAANMRDKSKGLPED